MTPDVPPGFEDVTSETLAKASPQGATPSPKVKPLRYIKGFRPGERRRHVLKGLFGEGELSAVYGPPKSGKSFLVTSASLAIAEGADFWMTHRVKRPGAVLYLVMEGAGGFANRLDAWERHHGRRVPERFVQVAQPLRFLAEPTSGAAAEDVERIQATVAEIERDLDQPVVLVVVDTVARAMAGGDENSAADMGRFLAACASLQALSSRPHVCVVHHAGKDDAKGSRGSTALPAGVDTLVKVERGEGANRWRVEWAKDDPEGDWRGFELEPVTLDPDEDGDEVTSCVVVEAEAPTTSRPKRPKRPTGKNQAKVWLAMEEVEADPQRERRATQLLDVPYEAVRVAAVKEKAISLGTWDADTARKRFPEALDGLVVGRFIKIDPHREWMWRRENSE